MATVHTRAAAMPYRLVHVPSHRWKWLFLTTAFAAALTLGYVLTLTTPPLTAAALLSVLFVPLIASLLWLASLVGRPTTWEVTDTHVRHTAAGKTVFAIPLAEIDRVTVSGTPLGTAVLEIWTADTEEMVYTGLQLTHQDVQFLYRAIASSLGPGRALPAFDWPLTAPTVQIRWAGRRLGLWGETHAQLFVAPPVIIMVLGALFVILGLLPRYANLLPLGVAMLPVGAVLLHATYRYLERRRAKGRLEF